MDKPAEKQDEVQDDQALDSQLPSNLGKMAEGVTEMPVNPSTADIMGAISKLHENVDSKFNNIATSMQALHNSLEATSGKVREVEEAVNVHDERIADLESKCTFLQAKVDKQQKLLEDLESHSRRQNIRILGIPEGSEKGKPTEFVAGLIPTLLGAEHFELPVVVDRAHRSLAPRPAEGQYPRPLIVRLHHYQIKERIIRLASQHFPLEYMGSRVHIFPDLSEAVRKQRKCFDEVRQMCKIAKFKYGFLFPARFHITVDGVSHVFEDAEKARQFLDGKQT